MSLSGDPSDDVPVEMPDVSEFVTPSPVRKPLLGRRKPAGDKSDDEKPPRTRKAPAAVKVPNRKGQFVKPVNDLYMSVGALLLPMDAVCANAIIMQAREQEDGTPGILGVYWDELAYQNESVRRFLWGITQTSLATKLFMAHIPIFLAVFMHHSPWAQRKMGEMGSMMADIIANQMNANGPVSTDGDSDSE